MPSFQPVLSADAMREADRFTIDEYGLPGFTLMETAGRGAADHIEKTYGPLGKKSVTCFCGKGNNGGDGFVVARLLYSRGACVRVFTMSSSDNMREDAARNLRLLTRLADEDDTNRLSIHRFESLAQAAGFAAPDLYIDALLGTGLTSDLREPIRGLVGWLNGRPQPVTALDVPTGLHSDTGRALGTAVEADLTITMAALKAGLLINDGPHYAGHTEVVEIGIPHFALRRAHNQPGAGKRPTEALIRSWLPRRAHDAHKYSAGLALVIAGSPGLTGAPMMASTAAARSGAGAVVCACPESVQPILAGKMTEIMTLALPETEEDDLAPETALEALEARMEKASALLVGPGLGQRPGTQQFIRTLLATFDGPVVLDADGLNALAGHTDLLAKHAGGQWILTPHAGEFKRLADDDASLDDRLRIVQQYAERWNCILLLKGMPSLIGCPDGTTFVNPTGSTALATAGTGDVLAGLCTGLLSQGLPPRQAAACALYLGSAAAERYVVRRHPNTLMAMDLLDELPLLLHERFPQQ